MLGRHRFRPATFTRSALPFSTGVYTDFGRMGILFDPHTERRRVVHALIVVSVWSRHMFVWLTFGQTTSDVIAGLDAAWAFFGGVFPILIPDNLTPVITKAEPTEPRINDTFLEYSQARKFLIDAARVRHPKDKPRVERQVPFVRGRFFKGEEFVDLADAQRRADGWCATGAGMRIHGTTRCRPAEEFVATEQGLLLPAPTSAYDVPVFSTPKVHRDHHVEVARAIYSVPGDLIGTTLTARADRSVVKLYAKGQLIKVHPRQAPGGRVTDPEDLPSERSVYALRDIDQLIKIAHKHGEAIGIFVEKVLDNPLPWTKMRQVYALLGLVKRWGAPTVEAACARALETEVVNVPLIGRMIARATENQPAPTAPEVKPTGHRPRFARDPGHFATKKPSNHKAKPALEAEGGVA